MDDPLPVFQKDLPVEFRELVDPAFMEFPDKSRKGGSFPKGAVQEGFGVVPLKNRDHVLGKDFPCLDTRNHRGCKGAKAGFPVPKVLAPENEGRRFVSPVGNPGFKRPQTYFFKLFLEHLPEISPYPGPEVFKGLYKCLFRLEHRFKSRLEFPGFDPGSHKPEDFVRKHAFAYIFPEGDDPPAILFEQGRIAFKALPVFPEKLLSLFPDSLKLILAGLTLGEAGEVKEDLVVLRRGSESVAGYNFFFELAVFRVQEFQEPMGQLLEFGGFKVINRRVEGFFHKGVQFPVLPEFRDQGSGFGPGTFGFPFAVLQHLFVQGL